MGWTLSSVQLASRNLYDPKLKDDENNLQIKLALMKYQCVKSVSQTSYGFEQVENWHVNLVSHIDRITASFSYHTQACSTTVKDGVCQIRFMMCRQGSVIKSQVQRRNVAALFPLYNGTLMQAALPPSSSPSSTIARRARVQNSPPLDRRSHVLARVKRHCFNTFLSRHVSNDAGSVTVVTVATTTAAVVDLVAKLCVSGATRRWLRLSVWQAETTCNMHHVSATSRPDIT
ncbi:hypothetical protein CBL_07919 [Carabus blaptoides fortunei]